MYAVKGEYIQDGICNATLNACTCQNLEKSKVQMCVY